LSYPLNFRYTEFSEVREESYNKYRNCVMRHPPLRDMLPSLRGIADAIFGFGGGGPWGRDWEERKTREMMDREGGS
jgi:hypothetical protein